MKKIIALSALLPLICANSVFADSEVSDEASLMQAIAEANANPNIKKIRFEEDANIVLNQPVIYSGTQDLVLIGDGATIDGSAAGSFVLDQDLTAVTEDGTLVFNTAASITIKNLNVLNSATRGIVVNIPEDAVGNDQVVNLHKVVVRNSALYGIHIDDNRDEFDDGNFGSAIGLELNISKSSITFNGIGALDFDGIRVDERSDGDIVATIRQSEISDNGGDGIELDEAGKGDVIATVIDTIIDRNGFYNAEDYDDGFDIDEGDEGSIWVNMIGVSAADNKDEGLDFDEAGSGSVNISVLDTEVSGSGDEGLKVDEEGDGDINFALKNVESEENGDDGIQFTEQGEGQIFGSLTGVEAEDNAKYGVTIGQWLVEDEPAPVEAAGQVSASSVELSGNASGDVVKLNNVNLVQ